MVSAARAALITGGSSGIGLAIARAMAEDGYRVTLAARRGEALEAAAAALRADGLQAQGVVADMSREQDVIDLVTRHRELWGRLDVLVNNAGVGVVQEIERIETEQLDQQLAVNLRGVAIATREALPMLREAGSEHGKALIVNIASISGATGQAGASIYAATKAAVLNFTESTHREVGADGIQCTALAPSFVDTPMMDFIKQRVPGETMIRPQDLGEAVRFLLRTSTNCHVSQMTFTMRLGVDT